MRQRSWAPDTVRAMLWARQLAAQRGLAPLVPEDIWLAWGAHLPEAIASLRMHRLDAAAELVSRGVEAPISDELSTLLAARHRSSTMRAMRLAQSASWVQAMLTEAGVPALFVKGTTFSEQAYGDFAARGAGDIDVLVAPADFRHAEQLLVNAGASGQPRGADTPLGQRVAEVHHASTLAIDGTSIDLHQRLSPMPSAMRTPFETLWDRRFPISVAGCLFATLDPLDACVLTASHASQDNWAFLRDMVDFGLGLAKAAPDLEVAAVLERAEEHGVSGRMRLALEVTRALLPTLPRQGPRERAMADWAWSRHRQGRLTRGSGALRDATSTYAFWIASEGDLASLRYGVKRLMWLPSGANQLGLPESMWWAAPALAPVAVGRRLIERSRGTEGGRREGAH